MVSMHSEKPYALHPVCQTFLQRHLWNSFNVRLIDDGPLSSFQGRSSSALLFTRLSPPGDRWCNDLGFVPARSVLSSSLNTSDLLRRKPLVRIALPASLSAPSFTFTPACPVQHTNSSFRRWMSTTDTFQSGFPIPLFTLCSKLIESVRMMTCVVRLSPLEAIQRRAWVIASTSIVKLEVETV